MIHVNTYSSCFLNTVRTFGLMDWLRKYFFVLIITAVSPLFCLATGDSTAYLTPQDTVFIHLNYRGQKLLQHRLEKGQTLYSLAKFYGLSMDMVYDYNPHLSPKKMIPLRTEITIPIPNKAIIRRLGARTDTSKLIPICYRVKRGDTVYGVAKRALKMPVEEFMNNNNLSSYSLEVGQILRVGWMRTTPIPKSWQINAEQGGIHGINAIHKSTFLRKTYGKKTKHKNGKAQWNKDDNIKLSGLYCLHKEAPTGSIIRIENAVSSNVVYAKVLGKIPMNYEPHVIVVVSRDVAKALLEEKSSFFFVKIEYQVRK